MEQLYGIIGKPLEHSLSPAHFNAKFRKLGLHASYKLFPLESIDGFPKLIAENPQLCGLNVTIPYKQDILHFLNEVDFTAKIIGAVNTIVIRYNRDKTPYLIGYNTDALGFEQSLYKVIKQKKCSISALILGTGGSAKAVKYVLRKLGIPFISVDRNNFKLDQIKYSNITLKTIEDNKLIINTTPLGMYPKFLEQAPLIPYEGLTKEHILFDLVYNPEITAFLQHGIQSGCTIITGKEMFINQAENAWKIWQKHKT